MPSSRLLSRPTLISMWSNRVLPDALKALVWPRETLVLQPGKPWARSFVETAMAAETWPCTDAVLGASVRNNLHSVTIGAIADLVTRRTGRSPRNCLGRSDSMSMALATWLPDVAGDPVRFPIPMKQLSYVFASGAHRARAIARTLSQIEHRLIRRVTDIGTAAGMIPWLLQHDLPQAAQFDLFEPDATFRPALEDLWHHRGASAYRLLATPAEQADFAANADLVMICQCLYRVTPKERRAVLNRAWRGLNSGGVLLVNEQLRDTGGPSTARGDIVHRDELLGLMPGQPRVFSRKSDWTRPEDLRRVSARSLGYSGIVVSVRDT